MRDKYEAERKVYNAIKDVVLHKPKLTSIHWMQSGTVVLHFWSLGPAVRKQEGGWFWSEYPEERTIEVELPNMKTFDTLDINYVNRRMGYQAIPPLEPSNP